MGFGFLNKHQRGFSLDGFDPEFGYQMIPVGDKRDLVVETDVAPAMLALSSPGVKAKLGNFQSVGKPGPVPNAHDGITSVLLPAKSTIQFSVTGIEAGLVDLTLTEQVNDLGLESAMTLRIKEELTRRMTFVYVSDLVRKSVRGKCQSPNNLDKVKAVFNRQANVTIREVPNDIQDLHVLKDLGDPFNIVDQALLLEVNEELNRKAPNLFKATDFIVYLLWNVRGKHKSDGVLGINQQRSDKLNTVFLGLEPSNADANVHIMAHEFGHAMGLAHLNESCLMFPTTATLSNRLPAGHIEQLRIGPIFPGQPVLPNGRGQRRIRN